MQASRSHEWGHCIRGRLGQLEWVRREFNLPSSVCFQRRGKIGIHLHLWQNCFCWNCVCPKGGHWMVPLTKSGLQLVMIYLLALRMCFLDFMHVDLCGWVCCVQAGSRVWCPSGGLIASFSAQGFGCVCICSSPNTLGVTLHCNQGSTSSTQSAATSASHECGHNFGLNHVRVPFTHASYL